MIKVSIIYKYKNANSVGTARVFCEVPRIPPTMQDLTDIENMLCKEYALTTAFICNIIPIADDGAGGEPHD